MTHAKTIKSALLSVYYKDQLEPLVRYLAEKGVQLFSTGGTQLFIEKLGVSVVSVSSRTQFPEILGGRVKTLHPTVFGGILNRRENLKDQEEVIAHDIPSIDLVIVDLYPFEETVKNTTNEEDIIEKIDIGGVSLIRAAAKNHRDVVVLSSKNQYHELLTILKENDGKTLLTHRKKWATEAFMTTASYDMAIGEHFSENPNPFRSLHTNPKTSLRYGENPHQSGWYSGDLAESFDVFGNRALSYNNLMDADAAIRFMEEFRSLPNTFAIFKHNTACGVATTDRVLESFELALACDPISAFGGVLICNGTITYETAKKIDALFYEILIAPGYEPESLDLLTKKKNRIILKQKPFSFTSYNVKTLLNGYLIQENDGYSVTESDLSYPTNKKPSSEECVDLLYANHIVKHTKSNAIVLVKNRQLLASGTGQTSRVDALEQAISKAKKFGFSLEGAVMASDAFFPFPDCVEIAHKEGVTAVIQPGGSVKDNLSIAYCNENGIKMVFTGIRHFKH
jgi:phosphoribosylaminoimidazolecarboxamide formyltransferase/IMP cyclohydrolase